MSPAMIKIRNKRDDNIEVKLTLKDSIGNCNIPWYPISSKNEVSKYFPVSCLPLYRVDIGLPDDQGGCSWNYPPYELNVTGSGGSCEMDAADEGCKTT